MLASQLICIGGQGFLLRKGEKNRNHACADQATSLRCRILPSSWPDARESRGKIHTLVIGLVCRDLNKPGRTPVTMITGILEVKYKGILACVYTEE